MSQSPPTLQTPQEKLFRLIEAGLLNQNPTWDPADDPNKSRK